MKIPKHRKNFHNCLKDKTICGKIGMWRILTRLTEKQQRETIEYFYGAFSNCLVDKELVFINKRSGGASINGREIVDFNQMGIACLGDKFFLVQFDVNRIQ